MKAWTLFLVLGLGTAGAVSCKKSGGGGGTVPLALTSLGLTAQVPEGTTADKAIVGEGLTLQGPDLVVGIEAARAGRAKTVAEAKTKADLYTPKNMKDETLPDGWAITFENETAVGTGYWLESLRTIGGKAISCTTTATTVQQQANALAVCKSLK
jgi:hypothetical protein